MQMWGGILALEGKMKAASSIMKMHGHFHYTKLWELDPNGLIRPMVWEYLSTACRILNGVEENYESG